jgi:predicted amidohydrolase
MVKVAIVQSSGPLYDTEETIKKLRQFAEKAAKEKADLVLFPGNSLNL